MIRVLHVLNNLGSGGAESLLMNVYRKIDRDKVQFDFLIRSDKNGPIVDEILSLGGRVFCIAEYPRHFFRNGKELKAFLKEHREYSIIHVHANALIYIKPLVLAKRFAIPCRIIHSHSITAARGIPFLKQIHSFNRERIKSLATHRFACSEAAGKWMFGSGLYKIVNNGIDLETIQFCVTGRERIRKQYQLENSFVIGNVGRFSHPKNHPFMIRLFAAYAASHPDARLLLVGEGELFDEIQALAKQLKVYEKITFTGAVSNVADYLSAMDVFLFPSLYEGLGMALVEAQAAGLPCIVSNTVPNSAILNDNCRCVSLNAPMETWIDALNEKSKRETSSELLRKFDINVVAKELEANYLEMAGHRKE